MLSVLEDLHIKLKHSREAISGKLYDICDGCSKSCKDQDCSPDERNCPKFRTYQELDHFLAEVNILNRKLEMYFKSNVLE